jgi:uncharacterized protein YqjF (DUF2071 family)
MTQTWHNLLFAHWPVPVDLLRPAVPHQLALDTCGGTAWIGVIAFRLSGIRLRGTPEFGPVSHFPEVNVRTYVRVGDMPGVYFMSLDADNPLAIALARPWFRLPYYQASIGFSAGPQGFSFSSRRTRGGAAEAEFSASYMPESPAAYPARGTLEHWLTERYCYYTVARSGRLYRCEVHHAPWPLQRASAEIAANTMALSHGIMLPETEPVLHYANYMKALIWPLRRVRGRLEQPHTAHSRLPSHVKVE